MTKRLEQIISYGILTLFSFIAIWPLVSIILLAFNNPGTLVSGLQFPRPFSMASFIKAWTEGGLNNALFSSFVVAVVVVVASVLASLMTGYVFGTMEFRGSSLLFYYFMIGIIVPYEATVIPLFYQFHNLNLINTYWAMILPQTAFSISFGTFWMRAFFRSFPKELIDAGRTDGAGLWTVLWRVIVPNTGPSVLALSAILFIWTWNELLLAIVMIQKPALRMAPAALSLFAGVQRTADLPVVAAATVLVALPVLIIYLILQRRFIEGVVAGALTG